MLHWLRHDTQPSIILADSHGMERDTEELPALTTSCAWCNQEAGIPQGEGSHGICDYHAEQVLKSARARRAH